MEGIFPASSLWWDGFTIAKNISDEDAEATFIAMLNGISDEMVAANNDKAVWLMDAYNAGLAAEGVLMTAGSGAEPYPMLPYMGLLHSAAFQELPDFLQGNKSAEQTLADIINYTTAAKEKGFLYLKLRAVVYTCSIYRKISCRTALLSDLFGLRFWL